MKRSWNHWVVVCAARDKSGVIVSEIEFDFWKKPSEVTPGIDPEKSFRKNYPLPDEQPWVDPNQHIIRCN